MPEIILHYIWQERLFDRYEQHTTDGQRVEVVSVGKRNSDAGPDFFNAHIRLYDDQNRYTEWVGNVEIHINASDWYKHRHQNDKAYDNVILHVVNKADKDVFTTHNERIPQCELQYQKGVDYLKYIFNDHTTQCSVRLKEKPTLLTVDWKKTLLNDRMKRKEESIFQLLEMTKNNWEYAFYITLAHNFGFHTNGDAFELLAKQTPLNYLQKHRNSLFQLTAILLGQAGLLNKPHRTDEENALLTEYTFLQKKFQLQPLEAHLWKKLRMRPQTFPEVRIRQFAFLLFQSEFLFSQLMKEQDVKKLTNIFTLQTDEYQGGSVIPPPTIGKSSIQILLINTVIPYQYAFAHEHADSISAANAVKMLEKIPPENNHIVQRWIQIGQIVQSAADTQALIHLTQNYCDKHRCTQCEIGYQIFSTRDPICW